MAVDGSPIHHVRLLIADLDTTRQVFTDMQIGGYLSMRGIDWVTASTAQAAVTMSAVRRAAADALDAIATSEALVSKVIRTQDLSTDGTKVADALRKQAASLRAQADAEDAAPRDDDDLFDVIEFSPYPRGW